MKNTNQIGYKQLMQYFANNDEEKETLQILFCEDKATFNELAEYYQTTPPTMRRVVMDVFGREGYLHAKNQRKFNTKNEFKYNQRKQKYGKSSLVYKVIKLLQDSDETYYKISQNTGCSRERVAQIAGECSEHGIKLNQARLERMKNGKYYQKRSVRGY